MPTCGHKIPSSSLDIKCRLKYSKTFFQVFYKFGTHQSIVRREMLQRSKVQLGVATSQLWVDITIVNGMRKQCFNGVVFLFLKVPYNNPLVQYATLQYLCKWCYATLTSWMLIHNHMEFQPKHFGCFHKCIF
jgi:hypothetical protein